MAIKSKDEMPSENSIDLSWDEPFTCPDGQFADCIGQCIDDWYEAWIGDGLCDDGTWDVYFWLPPRRRYIIYNVGNGEGKTLQGFY